MIDFLSSDRVPWIGRKFFSYINSLIFLAGCFRKIWKSVFGATRELSASPKTCEDTAKKATRNKDLNIPQRYTESGI
jgi:hypothetical protein